MACEVENGMILYHGSNLEVTQPRLLSSDRRLDFGTGFYLTSSYEQAERWARLTVKRRGNGAPTVTVFEMNEIRAAQLNVKRFERADAAWLRYISANRKALPLADDADIVIGPVANDRTMPVISLYFSGIYDEEETIKRLLPQKLRDQYAFKTWAALDILVLKEVRRCE